MLFWLSVRGRMLNVYFQGPDRAEQGFLAAWQEGESAESVMTRALNGVESTLGTWPSLGFRTTLESLGPNSRQAGLTEGASMSPTCLTDPSANSRAVFKESNLRLEDCNGSNGGPFRALSMVGKSQGLQFVRGRGGFVLLSPRKNCITASLPTDRLAIGAWKAAMAAA